MSGTGRTRGQALLTSRFIEALKLRLSRIDGGTRARPFWPCASPTNGVKSFDVAYRIKGSSAVKRTTIGRYGDIDLDEARVRAGDLVKAARKGKDLIAVEEAERDARARAMTLGALLELYISRRIANRLRSARSVASILRRVLEPLASMPAADVKRRDLLLLLEAIAARGHVRAAGHARTLIGGLFKWGLSQDFIENDRSRALPAYDQGTPRDRVLSPDEIHSFWFWLETLAPVIRDALRFQLATGCRIGEVGGLAIAEIDASKWLWTLPAARSKNKKPRVTPLIGVARTIIEERVKEVDDGILFPSENGNVHTASTIGRTLHARRSANRSRRSCAAMIFVGQR